MSRSYVEGDYRILLEDGGLTYHKIYLEEGTDFAEALRWVTCMQEGSKITHLYPSRLETFTNGEWVLV